MSKSWNVARRVLHDRKWREALADPNCIVDGSDLRIHRFARCGCGAVEGILLRESADGFVCCGCRAERVERFLANRKRFAEELVNELRKEKVT